MLFVLSRLVVSACKQRFEVRLWVLDDLVLLWTTHRNLSTVPVVVTELTHRSSLYLDHDFVPHWDYFWLFSTSTTVKKKQFVVKRVSSKVVASFVTVVSLRNQQHSLKRIQNCWHADSGPDMQIRPLKSILSSFLKVRFLVSMYISVEIGECFEKEIFFGCIFISILFFWGEKVFGTPGVQKTGF